MIRANSATSFEVDEESLPAVVERLVQAGLQERPGWHLHKDRISVSLTPNTDAKRVRYTVSARAPEGTPIDDVLLSVPEQIEQAAVASFIAQLTRAGFEATELRCFAGQRASVHLSGSTSKGQPVYDLDIKGFNQELIQQILVDVGLDANSLEQVKRRGGKSPAKPPVRPAEARLRATLQGAQPPIWREFTISTKATLWDLHSALIDLFGWHGGHLHEFQVPLVVERNGQRFLATIPWGIPDEEGTCLPSWRITLNDLIALESPALVAPPRRWAGATECPRRAWQYCYDFGDNWQVMLQVEAVEGVGSARLRCLNGAGRGPLDDCGGIVAWNAAVARWTTTEDTQHPNHQPDSAVIDAPGDDFDDEEGVTEWLRSAVQEEWTPKHVTFFDPRERLKELLAYRDESSPYDQTGRSLKRLLATFVTNSPSYVLPIADQTSLDFVYWIGTVEEEQLVLLGEQDRTGVVGPCDWYGPFEITPEQMVTDHLDRFVWEDVSITAISLPTQRTLDHEGRETIGFTALVIVPPAAHRAHPARAHEVAIPVATLTRTSQQAAMQTAITLVHQPSADSRVVAGRALLLASFAPAIRAVLGLEESLVAVPLPVLQG